MSESKMFDAEENTKVLTGIVILLMVGFPIFVLLDNINNHGLKPIVERIWEGRDNGKKT